MNCLLLQVLLVIFGCFVVEGNKEVIRANSEKKVRLKLLDDLNHTNDSIIRIHTKVSRLIQKEENLTTAANKENIDFVTSFAEHLNTWSISLEDKTDTLELQKSICFEPKTSYHENKPASEISVNVYNHNNEDVELDVTAAWKNSFYIEEDEIITVNVTHGSAELFQFRSKPGHNVDSENYLIEIKTLVNNNKCMYVSVNKPGCPWKDHLSVIENSELWARMLKTGFFPIKLSNFPGEFVMTLLPVKNSSTCFSEDMHEDADEDVKTVEIKVLKIKEAYLWPVLVSVSISSVVSIFFCILCYIIWGYLLNRPQAETDKKQEPNNSNGINRIEDHEQTIISNEKTNGLEIDETKNTYRHDLITELEKALPDTDSINHMRYTEAISRLKKKHLKVEDLCKHFETNPNFKTFLCAVPLISIFYLVPSAQMVSTDLERYRSTGNMEHCYLNYGCSRPWWRFTDFNHIISNAGYFINGIIFIILVFIKSKTLKSNPDYNPDYGIPNSNYSCFYALGICMILQSVFSSLFHVCPSNTSLQFDTTIMYIMMILVFIQTYSFRHSDISSDAFISLYAFSAALIMEALSLYVTSYTPKIILFLIFLVVYIILLFNVVMNMYYYGAIKAFFPLNFWVFMKHPFTSYKCLYPRRFFLSFCFVFINLGLMIWTIIRSTKDHGASLSNPFLVIGAVNIAIYLIFYLILKVYEINKNPSRASSRIPTIFCLIVLISSIFYACLAGWFYLAKRQSRNLTPQESRDKNELCSYLDFFDNHDMWHFFSAASLFLAFIFLLSIDDDLLNTPRNMINIF